MRDHRGVFLVADTSSRPALVELARRVIDATPEELAPPSGRDALAALARESFRSRCEKPAAHRQEPAAHELFRQLGHQGLPARA